MKSLPADSAVVSCFIYWNIMSGPSFSFHTYWGSSELSAVWERLLITWHILLEPFSAASSFAFLILCVAALVFTFWHLFFYCSCDLPMLMKIISRLSLCGLYILYPVFHLVVPSVLSGGQCFFSKERMSSCKKCIELDMEYIDGVDSDEVKRANCQAVNWPLWTVCL